MVHLHRWKSHLRRRTFEPQADVKEEDKSHAPHHLATAKAPGDKADKAKKAAAKEEKKAAKKEEKKAAKEEKKAAKKEE